ncbi:SphA family protein [Paraburkholderia oxyphila]|uniref:SphA family protein n=1 Tax=Paraburkholderia oxyphila TaxID=614212 RepID=UPI000A01AB31|nr:transporter [Paraburkholderia oxyphila]
MSKILVYIFMGAVSAAPMWSHASEGNYFGGPVGGTDIRNAYLPSDTGFYGSVVAGAALATHMYGDNGDRENSVQAHGDQAVGAFGLLYVYPFHLFGGTVGTSVQLPVTAAYLSIDNRHEYYRGFGDLYADLIEWSKYIGPVFGNVKSSRPDLPYGLTIKLAYSMIFPTGKYNTTQLQTPGHNVFFYIPNFSVTYLTGPNFLGDGLEFSAHVFFDFTSHNSATNYSSGPVYDIDSAITERFGRWQAGLSGYYARQWDGDIQDGLPVKPDGKRLVTAGVGPIIAYDIPSWKANVKFKLQFAVANRNTLGISRTFVVFSKAFQ